MAFEPTALRLGFALLLILLTSAFFRILAILPSLRPPSAPRTAPSHLCIVLGSGGHTAEMLSMIRNLDPVRYHHRTYIVSSGDAFSALKAVEFERRLQKTAGLPDLPADTEGDNKSEGGRDIIHGPGYDILTVPRARKIHQPLLTTPLTSLLCLLGCLRALSPSRPSPTSPATSPAPQPSPDLILTNGPATGVLVVLAAFILRFFGAADAQLRSVYVESWARVGGLSLSGRVLEGLGLVERFLVQWEKGLEGEGGGVERVGGGGRGKRRGGREWRGFLVA